MYYVVLCLCSIFFVCLFPVPTGSALEELSKTKAKRTNPFMKPSSLYVCLFINVIE